MQYSQYTWLIGAGLLLASCGSGSSTEADTTTSENEVTTMRALEEEESESQVIFVLPSTVQVGRIFQEAGLPYVDGITLSPDAVGNYDTKASKLLAYGMYSTDLSYAVLNNQNELALKQLRALKQLADNLGLTEIFSGDELFTQFEQSLGDQEAILNLMIEIQERTDSHIDDYELGEEGVVIFAGAWVEGMYLGVKGADPSEQEAVSKRLIEQMSILENLLVALDEVSAKSKQLAELQKELTELHNSYNSFEEVKQAENLIDIEVSLTHLHELGEQITAIREHLVGTEKEA